MMPSSEFVTLNRVLLPHQIQFCQQMNTRCSNREGIEAASQTRCGRPPSSSSEHVVRSIEGAQALYNGLSRELRKFVRDSEGRQAFAKRHQTDTGSILRSTLGGSRAISADRSNVAVVGARGLEPLTSCV
jgi:hypothetical protein